MSEEKKIFEAPVMTTLALGLSNTVGTSAQKTDWLTSEYSFSNLPNLNDKTE